VKDNQLPNTTSFYWISLDNLSKPMPTEHNGLAA